MKCKICKEKKNRLNEERVCLKCFNSFNNGQGRKVKMKRKEMKLGRVVINTGYTVDLDNEEMVQHAKDSLYEDIMYAVKFNELHFYIKVIEDKKAKENNIPPFLKGDE